MRRRDFIAAIGASTGWSIAALAQQPSRMRRIGVLMSGGETDQISKSWRAAFEQGLRKRGWEDGRNVRIEYRWPGGAGNVDRHRALASELVSLRPDVILAGGTAALEVLGAATRTIPIVFAVASDPISRGLVASLARPAGNVTGFLPIEPPLAGKWVELLKEIAPQLVKLSFLYNPETASYGASFLNYVRTACGAYGMELVETAVNSDAEIETSLDHLAREPNSGLIVLPSDFVQGHRERIIALATRYRLPAIYGSSEQVKEGGLISYSNNYSDDFANAAGYVDRILTGEKPADLPVQAPVKFELVVNLKAAKAIGLTIPETFLVRADSVIE